MEAPNLEIPNYKLVSLFFWILALVLWNFIWNLVLVIWNFIWNLVLVIWNFKFNVCAQ
tara:strand:+ start:68065 stop:68238 length:174 start_codon:yes stop_codon:yes gene_type:complete